MREWAEFPRIVQDKEHLGGAVRIRGTRIPVSMILSVIASGENREWILHNYPSLTQDDITEAIGFAGYIVENLKLEDGQ